MPPVQFTLVCAPPNLRSSFTAKPEVQCGTAACYFSGLLLNLRTCAVVHPQRGTKLLDIYDTTSDGLTIGCPSQVKTSGDPQFSTNAISGGSDPDPFWIAHYCYFPTSAGSNNMKTRKSSGWGIGDRLPPPKTTGYTLVKHTYGLKSIAIKQFGENVDVNISRFGGYAVD